ncbi:MAG: 1-deoxy-D-xylulose-5-phosphate reductoisomerase [Thermodesulfovibrionales bacterium]
MEKAPAIEMRRIAILGSTGSIGRSALDVIGRFGDRFRVVALTGHRNISLLLEQAERFSPEVVAVTDPEAARRLRPHCRAEVYEGEEGLAAAASWETADFVLSAIVGSAGLVPTYAAVRAGKTVGLANKESLVMAGGVIAREAALSGARILPVDSEHSAVFQSIGGRDRAEVRKITLTASGGPFVGKTRGELEGVTPEDALNHPNWLMGKKITVDSATLMNKGLEVIEAHHLFGAPPEAIDVLIHPQSIIHSLVEFVDGSSLAHMSVPDMRAAIAFALSYPERLEGIVAPLDLPSVGRLTFLKPDLESFPCLGYAYAALREGGTMPAVLNGANEAAVLAFLEGRAGFNDIPAIIRKTMDLHETRPADTIEAALEAGRWAAGKASELINALSGEKE